jgi:folate-binding protein YgfZ
VPDLAGDRLSADYAAFRQSAGVVELPRDFVRVAGPDAAKFLQGQLSQDVLALGADTGTSAWSLLLAPNGKVVALLRLTMVAGDDYILDTDAGWSQTVIERINRFKLRVKADVAAMEGWRCLAVRGPDAHQVAPNGTPADWPGLPGVDLLGPDVVAPDGVRPCSPEAYEVVRIEAGVPVMGRELNESTIPAEAGIVDRSVSFTKGCYTGQELVARIDSRGGNVPRRLRGLVLTGDTAPPPGATLHVDGKEVGVVTSAAFSPGRRAPVALAYVRRAVEPPADGELTWDGGSAAARIEVLPLVS